MKFKFLLSTIAIVIFSVASVSAKNVKVTNTKDKGIGSLRWALEQTNSDTLIDTLLFNIPATDPGCDTSTGVFTIKITSKQLPTINSHNLFIDGTSQTRFTGNTNKSILGTGGTVGCDGLTLSTLDGPEIEIVDEGGFNVGLNINANYFKVCGLAVRGFGNKFDVLNANMVICPTRHDIVIEKNVIGARAHLFAQPDSSNGGSNIAAGNIKKVTIKNNLIGFANKSGIYIAKYKGKKSSEITIENNEITGNGVNQSNLDGIDLVNGTSDAMVKGNLITNNAATGIDTWQSDGEWIIENNTLSANGKANNETPAIRVYGKESVVDRNKIENNYGAGILVTSGAIKHVVTKNCICNNGNVAGRSGAPKTNSIGIDLLYSNENEHKGNSPFHTINDKNDFDIGANGVLNYSVIENCQLKNGKLTVTGWTRPGSKVEFFEACTYVGAVVPQGNEFIASKIEGSSDDSDATVSLYGPGTINDLAQGTDSTNRFKYTFAAPNLAVNEVITSTATLNQNTSEFSGGCTITSPVAKISPVLECVYPEDGGGYTAVFGYSNPNSTVVNIGTGSQNEFVPSPNYRGQDTVFQPGRQWATFEVKFSGANLVWKLNGKTATANSTSKQCYYDLEVVKDVSNSAPTVGDTISFKIEVRNLVYRTVTNAVVKDLLSATSFTYLSYTASQGTYNSTTGNWNIPSIAKKDTAFLSIVAIADTTGDNKVCLMSADQDDANGYNDCSFASVCVHGSTGGNGGGLESNGNLASKIASRNYKRQLIDEDFYQDIKSLPDFSHDYSGARATRSSLDKYVPISGPNNSIGKITTPTDLIGISNAEEVLAVDYFDNSKRVGSIIAINSTNGKVYEHTKVICDRLNGATLEKLYHEQINGKPFIMSKITTENGSVDYSVTFVALKKANGTYAIDNRWNNKEYNIGASDSVFNFQVWTVSPNETRKLVSKIIGQITSNGSTGYENNWPPMIPNVFVKNGEYDNGILKLTLNNPEGATEIYATGNRAHVENGERIYLDTAAEVSMINGEYVVEVPVGFIFDAGFSLTNNVTGAKDVLYLADGPWGVEYKESGAKRTSFEATKHTTDYLNAGDYPIERGVKVTGNVKTYFSVFKEMRVGDRVKDVSAFNQLEFQGDFTGADEIEIVVSKNSIDTWSEQFRITVPVTAGFENYKIGFPTLEAMKGNLEFVGNDVLNFTFVIKGDNSTRKNFSMNINEVKLTNDFVSSITAEDIEGNSAFKLFPNPASNRIQLFLTHTADEQVSINVYDMNGRKVIEAKQLELQNGENNTMLNVSDFNSGLYIVEIVGSDWIKRSQVVIQK